MTYYLAFRGEGERSILGVGLFHKGGAALPVSLSIYTQYRTPEMAALGWEATEVDTENKAVGSRLKAKGGKESSLQPRALSLPPVFEPEKGEE